MSDSTKSSTYDSRAHAIVAECLKLAPGEQFQAAQKACADDPVLLRLVLEALRGSSLASSGVNLENLVSSEVLTFNPGGVVCERYELKEKLGRGGFGEVWRAYDKTLQREVALKLLYCFLYDQVSGETKNRALQEARDQARVRDNHVIQVFDVGDASEDLPFISLQLCGNHTNDGRFEPAKTLAAYSEKKVSHKESASLIAQVARGAQAAHQSTVIHKDINPNNILVTSEGKAYLSDFGLASRLSLEGDSARKMGGTLSFMSPEQAKRDLEGRRDDGLRTLTDIYSLGATLYYLLNGAPPFKAPTSGQSQDNKFVLSQIASNAPPPLKNVPKRLQQICSKAIAHEPADRYQAASDFASDLENWIQDKPTSFDTSRGIRIALWLRRNPFGAALLTTLFFVAAFGISSFLLQDHAIKVKNVELFNEQASLKFSNSNLVESLQRERQTRAASYSDRGRQLLHETDPWTASLYLQESYALNPSDNDTKYLLGLAMRPIDALNAVYADNAKRINFAVDVPGGTLTVADQAVKFWTATNRFSWQWNAPGPIVDLDLIGPSVVVFLVQGPGSNSGIFFDVLHGRPLFTNAAQDQSLWHSPRGNFAVTKTGVLVSEKAESQLADFKGSADVALFSSDETEVAFLHGADAAIYSTESGSRLWAGKLQEFPTMQNWRSLRAFSWKPGIDEIWTRDAGRRTFSGSKSFDDNGAFMAIVGQDGVEVWKTAPLFKTCTIPNGGDAVERAWMSPDGTVVATIDRIGVVRLWDSLSGLQLATIQDERGGATGLSFGPDSRQLLTFGVNLSAKRWDIRKAQQLEIYHLRGAPPTPVIAVSRKTGTVLALATNDSVVVPRDTDLKEPLTQSTGNSRPSTIAFSAKGDLIFGETQGMIEIMTGTNAGKQFATSTAASIFTSPQDQYLAAYLKQGGIRIWRIKDGVEVLALTNAHLGYWDKRVLDCFSADEQFFVSNVGDDVEVWDLSSSNRTATIKSQPSSKFGCVHISSQNQVLTTSSDGVIRLWDVSGNLIREFSGHHRMLSTGHFSSDGKKFVSAGGDGKLMIWDVQSNREPFVQLEGYTDTVTGAGFAADDRLVVSVGIDRTARIWSAQTGAELTKLEIPENDSIAWFDASINHGPAVFATYKGLLCIMDLNFESRSPEEIGQILTQRNFRKLSNGRVVPTDGPQTTSFSDLIEAGFRKLLPP